MLYDKYMQDNGFPYILTCIQILEFSYSVADTQLIYKSGGFNSI